MNVVRLSAARSGRADDQVEALGAVLLPVDDFMIDPEADPSLCLSERGWYDTSAPESPTILCADMVRTGFAQELRLALDIESHHSEVVGAVRNRRQR